MVLILRLIIVMKVLLCSHPSGSKSYASERLFGRRGGKKGTIFALLPLPDELDFDIRKNDELDPWA